MEMEKNPMGTMDREKRMNLSVLDEIRPKRSLEATTIRSRFRYFSHVMRAKGSLEQYIMLRQIAGHRRETTVAMA
jgi:hypothetical protein